MYTPIRSARGVLPLLGLFALTACSDGTGPGMQNVALSFKVTPPTAAAGGGSAAGTLVLDGTNGTLTIDEIRIVINEVELEPADGSCDLVDNGDDDDCPEFEAPPSFLNLPLDGTPIQAVTAAITPGTYKSIDFEVEDLEDDEDDPVEAAAIAAVRTQIMASFPDWPREASAIVIGSFLPAGETVATSFRVYLKAEIEVELDLVPNLVIADDGTANRSLTVDIAPHLWFKRSDGTVYPLHEWDYETTQQMLEFEVEMEEGFVEVEIDD